ncbi:hypothetical protein RBI14_15610 [Alcaligenaceae bacterium B3P038]|nr:hypothetical protein [Alcaligenaceae bacterium B3P038]
MSIDDLLDRQYDRRRYNCLHFAAESWERLTGDKRLNGVREQDIQGSATREVFRSFQKVKGPTIEPSVALMETRLGDVHIGVCLNRCLLHISEGRPEMFPIETFSQQFSKFRFYR